MEISDTRVRGTLGGMHECYTNGRFSHVVIVIDDSVNVIKERLGQGDNEKTTRVYNFYAPVSRSLLGKNVIYNEVRKERLLHTTIEQSINVSEPATPELRGFGGVSSEKTRWFRNY